MALLRHERMALGFLARHLIHGVVGALLFGGLVLIFDIGHLRSLAGSSTDGLAMLALFFFGLVITFGGVGMAIGVMTQTEDKN